MTDEVSFSESIRQVLSVERKIEGGCEVLLDKEQSLIRKGTVPTKSGNQNYNNYHNFAYATLLIIQTNTLYMHSWMICACMFIYVYFVSI